MKNLKSILVVVVMLFVIVTALLLLLTVFNLAGGEDTRHNIVKLAQGCAVIGGAAVILLGLTEISKK